VSDADGLLAFYLIGIVMAVLGAVLFPPSDARTWTRREKFGWVLLWWLLSPLWPVLAVVVPVTLVAALVWNAVEGWKQPR